jgi:radical SAM-linked protein
MSGRRVRIRYAKTGKVRWTSHRDLARMFERAFRRTRFPMAYSGGFAPRPRVSFGLALPTGAESNAEYLDAELVPDADVDLAALPSRLSHALPVGVDVTAAVIVDDGAPSLQEAVTSCTWRFDVAGTAHDGLDARVAAVLSAPSLTVTRTRKGRAVTDDLRPGILALRVVGGAEIECELATHPRAVRPAELAQALGPGLEAARVRRINQWIDRDGARGEPLDATDAPHAPRSPVAAAGARAR